MAPREEIPPYKRITAALREQIESGQLRPGEQVPSATQLQADFGVSRNTALRALRALREERLIRVEQGWGSFVTQPEERRAPGERD